MRVLMLSAMLVTCTALHADENPLTTHDAANGRLWMGLSAEGKLAFLAGYRNGGNAVLIEVQTVLDFKPGEDKAYKFYRLIWANLWPEVLEPEEVIAALDKFYSTIENRPIALSFALSITAARAKGTGEDEIQRKIMKMRAGSQPTK
jgi:hypothetical protein